MVSHVDFHNYSYNRRAIPVQIFTCIFFKSYGRRTLLLLMKSWSIIQITYWVTCSKQCERNRALQVHFITHTWNGSGHNLYLTELHTVIIRPPEELRLPAIPTYCGLSVWCYNTELFCAQNVVTGMWQCSTIYSVTSWELLKDFYKTFGSLCFPNNIIKKFLMIQ